MEIEVFFIFFLVLVIISFQKSLVINMTDTILGKILFIILIIYFSSKSPLLGLFITVVIVLYSGLLIEKGLFNEGFTSSFKNSNSNSRVKKRNSSKERMKDENFLRIGKSSRNLQASKNQNNTKNVIPIDEKGKHGFSKI